MKAANQRHVFSCSFPTEEPLKQVNEIARHHNCSRNDVIETFLMMYTPELFSETLPKFIEKKKQIKRKTMEVVREKRKQTKEITELLKNNPELLDKLKKELADDFE